MSTAQLTTESTNNLFNTIVDTFVAEQAKNVPTGEIMHNIFVEYKDSIEELMKDNYSRLEIRSYVDKFKREIKSVRVCALSEQSGLQRIAFGLIWQSFRENQTDRMKLGDKFLLSFRSGMGFYEYTMDRNFDERLIFSAK
jgi:CRISPR/Cas system-associated exonuclease Cas4 (RecB family)